MFHTLVTMLWNKRHPISYNSQQQPSGEFNQPKPPWDLHTVAARAWPMQIRTGSNHVWNKGFETQTAKKKLLPPRLVDKCETYTCNEAEWNLLLQLVLAPKLCFILWDFFGHQLDNAPASNVKQSLLAVLLATKLHDLGPWSICSSNGSTACLVVHLAVFQLQSLK